MFSWAKPTPIRIDRAIEADQRVYIVSDLHLGDGTRSDIFLGKDRDLVALIRQVRDEDAHLVIAGDAIDFHQAWSMSRVLKAHARLFGELAKLAETHGVTYIWGNHDYDISLFKDLLRFDVCSTLRIGDEVVVQHGYEYDPFIGPNLDQTHVATRVHHLVERVFDTWIRLPLENFYTVGNRVAFWTAHKFALALHAWDSLLRAMGKPDGAAGMRAVDHYWTQNQLGDPGCLFRHVRLWMAEHPEVKVLVTGHSHLPGQVSLGGGQSYVNTGSWTFNSAQYALWDGTAFTVQDWNSGREYRDHAYIRLRPGHRNHLRLLDWWRENYMGWLRYRVAENARLPKLP